MSNEPTDVMIGAYLDVGPAKADYQAVIDSGGKIEGAVCVSRDHAGKLAIAETDHMANKGAEVVGGLGSSSACSRRLSCSRPRSERRSAPAWANWSTQKSRARSSSRLLRRFRTAARD